MDERRAKIQEDLRGLIEGEIRCDDVFLQLYASDASVYHVRPLGIVRPRSEADVVACVQYAGEKQIPLHARGAGTGLAGESLGPGLVIDFSKSMRRIVSVRGDRVRVQAGATLQEVNRRLAAVGRRFVVDPANGGVTTMGSVVAVNPAGSRSVRYGQASDYVESLRIVAATGEALEVGREPLPGTPDEPPMGLRRDLVAQSADVLRRFAEPIEKRRPKSRFNRSGYQIWDVLDATTLNLAKFLTGSEGTLALVTEAEFRTVPLPNDRVTALFYFDRLDAAARAALEIRELKPTASDLLDRRLLTLARDADARYDLMIPPTAEAALLAEFEGDSPGEARAQAERVKDLLRERRVWSFDDVIAESEEEMELHWHLARHVTPTLYRLKGAARPLPFVEDVAVPPETLPTFLVAAQNVLKRHHTTASLFAHAGHGQLHMRPFLDLRRPEDVRTMRNLAGELYELVFQVGGTIAGEHGDGLSRTPYVPMQYGEVYSVLREVKRIFDPQNILNPGKIVGDDPFLMIRNLREAAPPAGASEPPVRETPPAPVAPPEIDEPEVVPLQLRWTPAEVVETTRSCNGCGACRTQQPNQRMCPIFRAEPEEEASPRAKANLLRSVMTGVLPPTAVHTDEFKAVADLCVNCKMCKLECPAGVDIPQLVLEAKAEYAAVNGLSHADWISSRIDLVSALGSRFAPVANWMITRPRIRWLLEKITGIAEGRKIPRFAHRSYLSRAARKGLTKRTGRSGPKVLYFVDSYANYHDPQLAEAFTAILEHNGIAVYVPPNQAASGMPAVQFGALDRARQVARHNLTMLAEGVREGYTIVSTEPSTVLCLTQEYPNILDDSETQLIAEHTVEAGAFLRRLHRDGRLKLDFDPIDARVAYHQPCHLRALGVGSPGEQLLRQIPKLSVRSQERGCSGMAGVWGLQRKNVRASLRAGFSLISSLRDEQLDAGTTECSACRLQMEQGTTKPTVHPIKLLAAAYGLGPSAEALLSRRSTPLVTT